MNEREQVIPALKMLIGTQLIVENTEDTIASGIVSGQMKQQLNILKNHANKMVELYWKVMRDQPDGEEVEIEFNQNVGKVEQLIESFK